MEFDLLKLSLLFLIIIFSQTVETTTGFGATVIALSLGVNLFPLKELVVVLVMIGCLQSAWIVARGFKNIRWRILLGRIILGAGLGMPVGIFVFRHFQGTQLKPILGIFVIIIASYELYLLVRSAQIRPLPLPLGLFILFLGGVVHGTFATGGPLVVYYSSREIQKKEEFRPTISMLWLILNLTLLGSYIIGKNLKSQSLIFAGILFPALVLGIIFGEIIHKKISERAFKFAVQIILLLTGIFILI